MLTYMAGLTDRRREERFPLAIPIAVWTLLSKPLQGVTRDVSTFGVYLYLKQPILVSTVLTVMMRMPTQLAGHTDTLVWAHGKAVRVECLENRPDHPWGVATWIEGYTFVGEESEAAHMQILEPLKN